MAAAEFDLDGFRAFAKRLEAAARGDFRKALVSIMQSCGLNFLQIVQDEIKRLNVVDTYNLHTSFHKGGDDSVWEISDGGLTLEVGTATDYAAYVNDGHWANPEGVEVRFIPGFWHGNHFVYDDNWKKNGTKTGMVLKQQWIEGAHYWESAITILEKAFPDMIESKLQEWLGEYFGDFI